MIADLMEEKTGNGISVASAISCSICLESVADNRDRSTAKLQCGHEFHLDCIGSAFNAKGLMQCPNCRKIEKGQWLYANGHYTFPEFSVDDWTRDEDLYDLSYSELAFGVNWCPFSGLTRLPSAFEEGELPSTAYRDLLGPHAFLFDQAGSSSRSCPFVAYVQLLQPSSSSSHENVSDGSGIHHQWSSHSEASDMPPLNAFPTIDPHNNWERHSSLESRIGGVDHTSVRSLRPDSDALLRSRSFLQPSVVGHGSGSRAGTAVSAVSSTFHGNSVGLPRVQNLRAGHQQLSFSGPRPPLFSTSRHTDPRAGHVGPTQSLPEQPRFFMFPSSRSSGRNVPDPENSLGSGFYAWERDRFAPYPLVPVERDSSWWGPIHHGAASETSRSGLWQRHGSERPSSQGRAANASYQATRLGQLHPYL